MKRLALLLLLTGLLACQEPGVQPLPPESKPTPQPSATATPTESPEPEPSQTPEPEPTPVQRIEVQALTPPAFLDTEGKPRGSVRLALERQAENPRLLAIFNVYDEYREFEQYTGLWQIHNKQSSQQIDAIWREFKPQSGSVQANQEGFYVLSTTGWQQFCIHRYTWQDAEPSSNFCFPRPFHQEWFRPEFRLSPDGEVFVFLPFLPPELDTKLRPSTTAYQLVRLNGDTLKPVYTSQPVGVDRIIESRIFMEEGFCWGICYLHQIIGRTSGIGVWLDKKVNLEYMISSFYSSSIAGILPKWDSSPQEKPPWLSDDEELQALLPENDEGRILLIKDGSSERASFWRPSGLDMDRQGNFYVQDRVAQDFYIRQIAPDGTTSTLVSANGLTKFGYPESKASMKAALPSEQQVRETPEAIWTFVVDYKYDWLYIQGQNFFRFDLRTEQLELLALTHLPDSDIKVNQLDNLNIDAEGHLYATHDSRILKILLPQPEGRR